MGRIHRSCLREWVQYRGSNRCEICNQNFEDISSPVTPEATPSEVFVAARRREVIINVLSYKSSMEILNTLILSFVEIYWDITAVCYLLNRQIYMRHNALN